MFLLLPVFVLSCGGPSEVNIKDCNAFGGVIRYEGEMYTGKVKKYFDDGTVEWDFNVINGVTDGDRIEYRKDGSKEVTVYEMGTITRTKYYDPEGKLINESIFNEDGSLNKAESY